LEVRFRPRQLEASDEIKDEDIPFKTVNNDND
jgi:hypothetical protein